MTIYDVLRYVFELISLMTAAINSSDESLLIGNLDRFYKILLNILLQNALSNKRCLL